MSAIAILQVQSGLAWPQARSYGCDPPLELEASSSSNMLHLQLQLPQTAHRCSSFRNHRPVTQPLLPQSCMYVCMSVCVRGENRKIIAWKLEMAPWKKRGQQTRPAWTNDRQKEAGNRRHTHTQLHSSCCKLNEFNWKTAGRSRSQVRRVLGSPANRIIPFVCTLMGQLRHLCCQDKVQLTQA